MRAAAERGDLELPARWTLPRLCGLLNKLGRVPWNVKILERYAYGRGVATYLARYLRGGPISNARLLEYRARQVTLRYRDNRDCDAESGAGRVKKLTLPVAEFLRRLLEHVPPGGMQTLRGWGPLCQQPVRQA